MSPRISIPQDAIADFCRRNGNSRLSLFGSVLRDDFRPDSDVDMLVEFESGRRIGLLGMASLQNQLTDMIGRQVDLRTPAELSRYFRDDVLQAALPQYEVAS